MKFINFVKSLLLFLLFIIFNFIIRNCGLYFLFACNYITEFDIIDKIILYLFVIFVAIIMYVIVFYLKPKVKNSTFHSFADAILSNKIKKFLWVTVFSISFLSGWILLMYPILYYYIFKIFFKDFRFIRKYYLDFKTVKKYLLFFFIMELYFILGTLYSVFNAEADGWDGIIFWTYYMLGNFYFYLPFFILSWWDKKKLKVVE